MKLEKKKLFKSSDNTIWSFEEGTSQIIRQHAGQNLKDAVLQIWAGTDEAQELVCWGGEELGHMHIWHTRRVHDWDHSFTFLYQVYLDAEWSCIYLYQCKYLY